MPIYDGTLYRAAGGDRRLAGRFAAMQAVARSQGIEELPAGAVQEPGFFFRAIDFLFRPAFAVSGAIDTMLGTGQEGEQVQSRILRELMGKGDKERFAEILEQNGMGAGGELSDLIGENWVTRKWNPTARGALGLALDVATDPLTYINITSAGTRAISRGGVVRMSKEAEKAFGHILDTETAKVARRLGMLRLGKEAHSLGALKKAGRTAEKEWWAAVDKGIKARGDMFARIQAEAHESQLRILQNAADATGHQEYLVTYVRKRANDQLERVLNRVGGRPHPSLATATDSEVAQVLKAAGVGRVEDLIADTHIRFMGVPLINVGKSGRVSRLVHSVTDPAMKRFFKVLESNEPAFEFYKNMKRTGQSVRKTIHDLFNRDAMGMSDLEASILKGTMLNKIARAYGDVDQLIRDTFKDNWDPDYVAALARFRDNRTAGSFQELADLGTRKGISVERTRELLSGVHKLMSEVAHRDVANGVLNPEGALRYLQTYVPHKIVGWDQLDDIMRDKISGLAKRARGPGKPVIHAPSIGRYNEPRFFDTYDELEAFLSRVNERFGLDLKVDYDLPKLLAERIYASHEAAHLTAFFKDIAAKYARDHSVEQAAVLRAVLPELHGAIQPLVDSGQLTDDMIRDINRILARSKTAAGAERAKIMIREEIERLAARDPDRARKTGLLFKARREGAQAAVLTAQKEQSRLRAAAWREAEAEQAEAVLAAKAERAAAATLARRQKLNRATLHRIDEILNANLAADLAKNPNISKLIRSVEVESVVLDLPAGGAILQKTALQRVMRHLDKARQQVRAELGEGAAEMVDHTKRMAGLRNEIAKKSHAKRILSEAKRKQSKMAGLAAEAAAPFRERRIAFRKEAAAIKVKRKVSEAEIRARDLADLKAMPAQAQAAVMRQMLHNIEDLGHLAAVFSKYQALWMKLPNKALEATRRTIREQYTDAFLSPYGTAGNLQKWKKVTIRTVSGKEEIWELPESIADDLMGWDKKWLQQEEVKGLLRIWDMLTNTFKTGVTVPFPAFHFRNSYSNIYQSALDITLQALNPVRHLEALHVMAHMAGRKGNQLFKDVPEGTLRTKYGEVYTYSHLAQLARAHEIKVDFNALAEIVGGKTQMGRADGFRLLQAMTKPGRFAGETIESEARMMHWLTLLRRGHSPADAALQMKRYLFDYSNLSGFEKNFLRRIIPFYTWNSKNIRLQMYEAWRKPGLAVNVSKPFSERGPQSDMLPEYVRGDLQLRLDPGPKKAAAFITGIDLPITAIDVVFSGSLERTLRDSIGLLNPLIKMPFELAFNQEAFTGQNIRGAQQMHKLGPLLAKFPKPMQDYFELQRYEDSNGRERYMANGTKVYLLFKSWALSRVMGTAAEVSKLWQNDEDVLQWWKLVTGLHVREYDMSEAQKKLLAARYDRLEREMIRRGLYLQWTTTYSRPDLKRSKPPKRKQTRGIFGAQ